MHLLYMWSERISASIVDPYASIPAGGYRFPPEKVKFRYGLASPDLSFATEHRQPTFLAADQLGLGAQRGICLRGQALKPTQRDRGGGKTTTVHQKASDLCRSESQGKRLAFPCAHNQNGTPRQTDGKRARLARQGSHRQMTQRSEWHLV